MKDIITNPKKSDSWNVQLRIVTNFIFSRDNDKEHVLSNDDNTEIEIYNKVDEVIKDLS